MTGYQSEQAEKSARLKSLEGKLEEYGKVQDDVQEWTTLIRQYRDADTLDRDMLLKLVDRIEVGEALTVDGEKEREIRIYYKFVGISGKCPVPLPPARGLGRMSGLDPHKNERYRI